MVVSSRTPEGSPNLCPVCGEAIRIEPSDPPGDAPCPQCGHLLWFTWEESDYAVVVKPVSADLRVRDLNEFLARAERRGNRFVLDLGGVPNLSSASLAKLINLKKKCASAQTKLELVNIHPDLREVFRI